MAHLEHQLAVVTGGANGIGLAIVERFVADGAAVAVLDRDAERGSAVQRRLGRRVHFVTCDVAIDSQVHDAVDEAVRVLGGVSVLVNNAGVNAYFDATQMSESDWNAVLDVDLKGAWLCSKYAIPVMVQNNGGSVINISSIHAFMTTRGMFPYAAAKAGLIGLTRNLALDYGTANVRVNAICPGWIHTHLVDEWLGLQTDPEAALANVLKAHPLGRIGTPQEVAGMAAFLASSDASFITGAAFLVDGGLSAKFGI